MLKAAHHPLLDVPNCALQGITFVDLVDAGRSGRAGAGSTTMPALELTFWTSRRHPKIGPTLYDIGARTARACFMR